MTVDDLLKKTFIEMLEKNKGNRNKTSEELGISVRTVRNWIRKWNLLDPYKNIIKESKQEPKLKGTYFEGKMSGKYRKGPWRIDMDEVDAFYSYNGHRKSKYEIRESRNR